MTTASTGSHADRKRHARAEAAAWIVRLHGPHRSAELEAGFRAWLEADAENGRQFERVTEVWEAGSALSTAGVPRVARWREEPAPRRWALAAMVLLALGLGTWGVDYFWLNPSYATRLGEQRLVRLDDGTRIAMNSSTRIHLAYRDDERRVRLDRGEAYFEVARDPGRPFIVIAGDHHVTALGTAFVVRHENGGTAVTLVEGKVAVFEGGHAVPTHSPQTAAPEAAPDNRIVLSPGQRLTFVGRGTPRLDQPRIDAVTAWRRGEVMLDNTTLADAVAEMNRYDERLLIIDDPRAAAMRVSGIYHAGDSAGFARTVAALYGLQVVHEPGRIHLRGAVSHDVSRLLHQ
jgi:transmembrane sensor